MKFQCRDQCYISSSIDPYNHWFVISKYMIVLLYIIILWSSFNSLMILCDEASDMNMANYINIWKFDNEFIPICIKAVFFFLFQLIDLHVYIVPPEIWRERYNNLLNQNVTETISAGIIRLVSKVNVIGQRSWSKFIPSDTRQWHDL